MYSPQLPAAAYWENTAHSHKSSLQSVVCCCCLLENTAHFYRRSLQSVVCCCLLGIYSLLSQKKLVSCLPLQKSQFINVTVTQTFKMSPISPTTLVQTFQGWRKLSVLNIQYFVITSLFVAILAIFLGKPSRKHKAIGQTWCHLHTRLHLLHLIFHAKPARCNFLLSFGVIYAYFELRPGKKPFFCELPILGVQIWRKKSINDDKFVITTKHRKSNI